MCGNCDTAYTSDDMKELDNITKHLKEEIEKETETMEMCAEHKDYNTASICQQRIIAYQRAIAIVKSYC